MKPSPLVVTGQTVRALARTATDPSTSFSRKLALIGGFTGSGLRFAHATVIGTLGTRPEKTLRLWDFERCPHCRIVREALSTLDLDAEIFPCPRGGNRFRLVFEGGWVF